jgi:imidazolonepropionase
MVTIRTKARACTLPILPPALYLMTTTFDLLITGVHLATMTGDSPYGLIRDGAVGIRGAAIAWVGHERDLPRDASALSRSMHAAHGLRRVSSIATRTSSMRGTVSTNSRLASTARPTPKFPRRRRDQVHGPRDSCGERRRARRAKPPAPRRARCRGRDDRRNQVRLRARYDERAAQLRAARRVAAAIGVDVRTTLLAGARAAAGVRWPGRRLHRSRLRRDRSRGASQRVADAVDAFCDTIGFTAAQTRRVFEAARQHGLR